MEEEPDEEFEEDDEEWMDDTEGETKKHTPEKVYIEINDKSLDGSPARLTDGTPFTHVGFMARIYGQSGPYTSPEGIQKAIESCKAHITRMGDIPVVRDLRESAKLTRWFT